MKMTMWNFWDVAETVFNLPSGSQAESGIALAQPHCESFPLFFDFSATIWDICGNCLEILNDERM